MITRKDFVAVAESFSHLPESGDKALAVKHYIDYALLRNPRFNASLFMDACEHPSAKETDCVRSNN